MCDIRSQLEGKRECHPKPVQVPEVIGALAQRRISQNPKQAYCRHRISEGGQEPGGSALLELRCGVAQQAHHSVFTPALYVRSQPAFEATFGGVPQVSVRIITKLDCRNT